MTATATLQDTVPPRIHPLAALPSAEHVHRVGHRPPRRPRHPRAACAPARGSSLAELAGRFALRLVEVLVGVRPVGQLSRHTTHDGYRQLARLVHEGPLRRRDAAGRPQLGPVHDFAPGPGVLEVCVRVEFAARHHMVAFRLEQHRDTEQWQCAAVDTR
ncbi:hypothetical protein P3T36_003142 [Kitasatospora sp. MAP12-15]|uniref:Rv3235 family protein n=1 Tax=unclassified Kitasatospora TaxID=2633591 RepID=UPI002476DAE3|nr:Rv3235 family protein [Kitasatospora sp. MAP12-44]MDH6110773.1 hypothetical protein [Kitasatospora sp. MAP12-44]